MRVAIATELNRRTMALTHAGNNNSNNNNFQLQTDRQQQQYLIGRHQQQQQLVHHQQMLQFTANNNNEEETQQQFQQQQQQQPDLITSTVSNIRSQPFPKRIFNQPPPAAMTSQVAEEEEEDNFYTAGVILQGASIAEKVVQASPVVCVQEDRGGSNGGERDRMRQRALVESIESNV